MFIANAGPTDSNPFDLTVNLDIDGELFGLFLSITTLAVLPNGAAVSAAYANFANTVESASPASPASPAAT
jgi:hypothetical protein